MSVGQKLAMLKIRSKSVTFLSLSDLEAAPDRTPVLCSIQYLKKARI